MRDCPICDSQSVRLVEKQGRDILICSNCRHMFWASNPGRDELAQYYRTAYTEAHKQLEEQEANRAYFRKHIAEIRTVTGKRDFSLLDYGSSYPVLVEEIGKAGASGWAVDPSREAMDWARARDIAMLTPDNLDSVPAVDVLRFSHVLEHLPDPRATLRTLLAKLKPSGMVIVTQPNFPVLRAAAARVELKDSVWPGHLHFFSPLSLVTLLESLGLTVVRFDTHPPYQGTELESLAPHVDSALTRRRLRDLRWRTLSSGICRFPRYLGQNSSAWAIRAGNKRWKRGALYFALRYGARRMRDAARALALVFLFLGGCAATTSGLTIPTPARNGTVEQIPASLYKPEGAGPFPAVALYPACAGSFGKWYFGSGVYRPVAPLLILIGEKDDWTPAEACVKLVAAAREAGQPVSITVYPGAYHSFDSPMPSRYIAGRVNPNAPGGRGATTGGDPRAWRESIREVGAFFEQHLRR